MNNSEARIKAADISDKVSLCLSAHLKEHFAKYIGKKIIKKDGTLRKSVRPLIPGFTHTKVEHSKGTQVLKWYVTTEIPVENGHKVNSSTISIGIIKDRRLVEII